MLRGVNYCWIKDRVAANNMIRSALRAVKSGNCERARRILSYNEAHNVLRCANFKTITRIYDRVERCSGRAA
jgi:hypothetical protein